MEQNAGHLTNYRNMKAAHGRAPLADAEVDWAELRYVAPERRMERVTSRYLPFVPSYVTGNLRMLSEFRRALRHGAYDAVFTNSWAGMLSVRQLRSVPTVVDFDSTPLLIDRMPEYGSPSDPSAVADLKYRLFRRYLLSASVLHAWSTWAKRSAVSDYGIPDQKVVVNPPGVDIEFLHPPAGHRRQPDRRAMKVLFVGGDFRRKGGELLLGWHAQAGHGIELHLVTRDAVPDQPGVVVHRSVDANTPELRRLYWNADVFVLPSLAECFGLATIEAMATGLPVVASDAGGTSDIVEHGGNGFLTRAGDARALAAALDSLISDESTRNRMGRRSREIALTKFDSQRNTARTMTILHRLAREHIVRRGLAA